MSFNFMAAVIFCSEFGVLVNSFYNDPGETYFHRWHWASGHFLAWSLDDTQIHISSAGSVFSSWRGKEHGGSECRFPTFSPGSASHGMSTWTLYPVPSSVTQDGNRTTPTSKTDHGNYMAVCLKYQTTESTIHALALIIIIDMGLWRIWVF